MTLNPNYCSAVISPGGCLQGGTCRKRHDIRQCLCGVVVLKNNFRSHQRGKQHKARLDEMINYQESRQGTAHGAVPEPRETFECCSQCNKQVPASQINNHIGKHDKERRLKETEAALARAELDKGGITVSHTGGIDFGVVEAEGVEHTQEVTVRGTDPLKHPEVRFLSCRMRSSTRGDTHGKEFSISFMGGSRWIKCHTNRKLIVVFCPSYAGRYEDTVELHFYHQQDKHSFVITRHVCATVGSREDHEHLRPTGPYVRKRQPAPFQFNGPFNNSLRPSVWAPSTWVVRLPQFLPSKSLIDAVYGHRGKKTIATAKAFLPRTFNETTYGATFQVLLHLEEEKLRQDLEAYAITGAKVKPNYPRYDLQVKGLDEGRPSVLVGDFILVSSATQPEALHDPKRTWIQGCVHEVHADYVSLRFGEDFNTYKGSIFDVRFVLNRLPHRRMHYALSNQFKPTRFLFPGPNNILPASSATRIESISLYNRKIRDEQLRTVVTIVNQLPGSVPFIVFGPPGTGKTVTIVEAIRQLLDRDPNTRILACAPSNSAADLIAQGMLALGNAKLFRLNSLWRKVKDLPLTLHPFSKINGNKIFSMPTREELEKFRVVVSTCIAGGVPQGLGLKPGHFTHIFIDEAGQAQEPEVMVPIKTISGPSTNVILAGDNQQLGPVIHSALAGSLGLRKSYLDRLMRLNIYNLDNYSGITIVKLLKNFRSHSEILQVSNLEFYNSELKACGDPMLTRMFENLDILPKKSFPIVFHGIVGRDEQGKESPSFFNIDEATLVKKYCMSLIENHKPKILPEHIGVITPYYAQRCKILDLFYKNSKLKGIKVGSVEEFQGQERRIIILSTVRSTVDYLRADIQKSLGFVTNPRRFNVAVTRAQSLLIVIGNPTILSLDPLWRRFLNFIRNKGGWTGTKITWDPEEPVSSDRMLFYDEELRERAEREMEETLKRLNALIMKDTIDLSDSDSDHDETPIFRDGE
ncbi:P-loop containing nucleoside triphosphate hydrolase protein [Collybia nuda]|uniref:RNA helicase n=1 Tax=Collybia nuda TaxID=64659 RepID=A0A9P6CA54_9AGAR|nr:P-loop containing nucleoside triphosphate hydrolase protein [Collybia nuda]